jgi:hypothetical protein
MQAEVNAKRAAAAPQVAPPPIGYQFNPEVIPDTSSASERTEEDRELDQILESVGIVDAYTRWCGKMTPKVTSGRTESIMVSCPKPNHADKNPSAWINTEKRAWFCGGCQDGGDIYDIAAFHHGLPVPGYKEGALFHKLRRLMGEDLGYTFNERSGGGYDIVPPVSLPAQPAPPPAPALVVSPTAGPASEPAVEGGTTPRPLHLVPQIPSEVPVLSSAAVSSDPAPGVEEVPTEARLAPVISIDAEADAYDPELDSESHSLKFAWREALAGHEDTFLYKWCDETSKDYSPEEYHLFSGLMLLGLAAGRDLLMDDGTRPVMANLAICYLGKTGSGKSTAQGFVSWAIGDAMPENDIGIMVEGVREVGEVASGEALIGVFQQIVKGSATGFVPIKGYVEFSELSGLLAKSSVQGSTLKTKMMDFIDGKKTISNSSQTHGTKVAKGAFAAFSTSSQPRALRKLLDGQDQASGYLNRWLYVAGPSKERPSYFGGTAVDLRHALTILRDIAFVHQKKNPMDPHVLMPVTVEAQLEFKRFFDPIQGMLRVTDDDMLSRLEIHYKKLMFCHAINRRAESADVEDVLFVEKLHPYILGTFKLVGAQIGRSQAQEFVDRVKNYIKRKEIEMGVGPNRSMLNDAMKTKNIGTKQVNEAVDTLVKAGVIEEFKVTTGKAGRPPVRLRMVNHD